MIRNTYFRNFFVPFRRFGTFVQIWANETDFLKIKKSEKPFLIKQKFFFHKRPTFFSSSSSRGDMSKLERSIEGRLGAGFFGAL